jgi:hypothetical protein
MQNVPVFMNLAGENEVSDSLPDLMPPSPPPMPLIVRHDRDYKDCFTEATTWARAGGWAL